MLRDHLRTTWRGLSHHKLITCVNVGGLALGLAVFFALTFYVQREFSWDAQWRDADRIYVTVGRREGPTGSTPMFMGVYPYVLKDSLQSRHPGAFEAFARVLQLSSTISYQGEEHSNHQIYFAEPAILDLFQFELVEGSLQDVFNNPRLIALSSKAAKVLFGSDSAIGKTLTRGSQGGSEVDYAVGAVYQLPEPTALDTLQFLALLDPAALPVKEASLDAWTRMDSQQPLGVRHYFKLSPGADIQAIEVDLQAFMDEHQYMQYGPVKDRIHFVPLHDLHLMPGLFGTGNAVERLWSYAAIGLLVLLISGCNFVMLATLRVVDRTREIGIRKTIGGQAPQLMRQYLLEVFLQSLVAALVALVLLELALPILQARLGFALVLDLWNWPTLMSCLGIVTAFTLISGLYPAFLLSRGRPATLLHNSSGSVVSRGNSLRKLLVAAQFAIVVMLLLASTVTRQQIDYMSERGRGFALDNLVGVRTGTSLEVPTLLNEFRRVPGVAGAASGSVSPGTIMVTTPNRIVAGDREALLEGAGVGGDYFSILSIPVLAGREFSDAVDVIRTVEEQAELPVVDVVLNESGAHALGFEAPALAVGQLLTTETPINGGVATRSQSLRVIGVVGDAQFATILQPPIPQWYRYGPQTSFIAVKIDPAANSSDVLAGLEDAWHKVMGDVAFLPLAPEMLGLDQLDSVQFEARVVTGSSLLAVIIALLGLYGLVATTVIKRVKEIGVRKTLGAERASVVSLLLWQFSKPIVIANLVAWPLGIWGVLLWLQRFPFRLDLRVITGAAVAASIAALLIAWLTVGLIAAKAASAKPVLALRYE